VLELLGATDWTQLTAHFGDELSAALPYAFGAAGLFIAILLAYAVLRKMLDGEPDYVAMLQEGEDSTYDEDTELRLEIEEWNQQQIAEHTDWHVSSGESLDEDGADA
jgi:hypothetical protein